MDEEVEDARGETGFGEDGADSATWFGGTARSLEDGGIAGGDGEEDGAHAEDMRGRSRGGWVSCFGGEGLLGGGQDGPRGDGENRRQRARRRIRARQRRGRRPWDGAIEAAEPAGDVEQEITGYAEVGSRPSSGAARLVDHVLAELVVPLLEDLGGLEEEVPAGFGERLLPCSKAWAAVSTAAWTSASERRSRPGGRLPGRWPGM